MRASRYAAALARAIVLAAGAPLAMTDAAATVPSCTRDGALPPSFRLVYDVQATRGMLAMSGENELRFERDGAQYTLVSQTSAPPLYAARQASRGTGAAQGLVPQEYSESRTRRAEVKVTFDWTAREVALGASGTRAAATPGMQDRLSVLLEVGRDVLPGKPPRAVEITVAGVRRVEPYAFTAGTRETIEVPAGRFDALRIERASAAASGDGRPEGRHEAKNEGKDTTPEREDRLELWLAPSLCGLPVRLRYRDEHGLVIENTLKAVELRR